MSGAAPGFANPNEKGLQRQKALPSLVGIYEGLLVFLLPIGLVAAIAASWRAFGAQTLPPILLAAVAAWILVTTRIVTLALIGASTFSGETIYYSAPTSYMAIAAACLSLTAFSVGPRIERHQNVAGIR